VVRILALLLVSSSALAAPLTIERVAVVGRVDTGPWTDEPTEARSDQRAELAAIAIGHRGKRTVIAAPEGVDDLRLGGKRVAVERLEATAVRWSTIEPHGFRNTRASNGATSDFYSNVSVDRTTFGRWLGYDHIDYFETALTETAPRIAATIRSTEPDAPQLPGLGTIFYKVEIDGHASPGGEAVDTFGLSRSVHRVSIRAGDDFLGWLTAYLLVPEVFGSAGVGRDHQTERFTGADCADVLVGALRRTGRTDRPYTNVAGLPGYARQVAPSTELDAHGVPDHPITGVERGDLIRIDYGGELRHHTPRGWDHVAALWEDRSDPAGPAHGGPDGQLDGFDLVIHMGHPRLVIEPLARQAPATVDVLRWRQK
jgi:hypothetical protein